MNYHRKGTYSGLTLDELEKLVFMSGTELEKELMERLIDMEDALFHERQRNDCNED